jgi:hypothetical protein
MLCALGAAVVVISGPAIADARLLRPAPAPGVLITNHDLPSFFPGSPLTFTDETASCLRRQGLGHGWAVPPNGQDALYRGGLIVTSGEQSVFSQATFAASAAAARRIFSVISGPGFTRCLDRALESFHRSVGVIPSFAAVPLVAPTVGQGSSTRRFSGTLYDSAPGVVGNAIDDDLVVIHRGRFVGLIGLQSIVAGPVGQLRPFPAALRIRLARLMAMRMTRAGVRARANATIVRAGRHHPWRLGQRVQRKALP